MGLKSITLAASQEKRGSLLIELYLLNSCEVLVNGTPLCLGYRIKLSFTTPAGLESLGQKLWFSGTSLFQELVLQHEEGKKNKTNHPQTNQHTTQHKPHTTKQTNKPQQHHHNHHTWLEIRWAKALLCSKPDYSFVTFLDALSAALAFLLTMLFSSLHLELVKSHSKTAWVQLPIWKLFCRFRFLNLLLLAEDELLLPV